MDESVDNRSVARPRDALQAVGLIGGADQDRTGDLLNAIQALSQLSYGPTRGENASKQSPDCQPESVRGAALRPMLDPGRKR